MQRVEFEAFIKLLRSADPMTYEEGYHSLTSRVDEVLEWLIDLEEKECNEQMKAKFLELIGESAQPQAIELLKAELSSPYYEVRMWAYSSLCYSESPECNKLAEEFKIDNPNEEFL